MKTILSCLALTSLMLLAKEPHITDASTPEAGKKPSVNLDIKNLVKAIQDQEDKVEEHRKVREVVKKTKGIIYQGNESKEDAHTLKEKSEEQLHEKQYADMEIKISVIELNLDRLKYLEGGKLIQEAKKIAVKDNPFQNPDSRLNADQKLDELKRLLESELQKAKVEIRKIPLKRSIYFNVEVGYKNEVERLELMKGALSRLLEKQKE